jgi:hypothetical protein
VGASLLASQQMIHTTLPMLQGLVQEPTQLPLKTPQQLQAAVVAWSMPPAVCMTSAMPQ